jgi:hypothetical protein
MGERSGRHGGDTGSSFGSSSDWDVSAEVSAVVLVEGVSDQVALHTIAERFGRDLEADAVHVVSMGGATNVGRFLDHYGPRGRDVPLAGLCDVAEEGYFRRALERAGLGSDLSRAEMAALGFEVCVVDLEDEFIRSLGTAAVVTAIDAQRELGSFRTFQGQPAQRGRAVEDQLRRFLGTRAGRKAQYARVLADAVDLDRVPRPLERLLTRLPPRPR